MELTGGGGGERGTMFAGMKDSPYLGDISAKLKKICDQGYRDSGRIDQSNHRNLHCTHIHQIKL